MKMIISKPEEVKERMPTKKKKKAKKGKKRM